MPHRDNDPDPIRLGHPADSPPDRWIGRCWSCQSPLDWDDAIELRPATENVPQLVIPCCRPCWGQIPVGQRLAVAERFLATLNLREHQQRVAGAAAMAAESLDDLLESLKRSIAPDWLRGN